MNISKYVVGLLDPSKVVNEVLVGLTIAIAGWLFYSILKLKKSKKSKKIFSKRLLSEIDRNQKLLKPLSDSVAKVLDNNVEFSEDDLFPNKLNFHRSIYSESSDKLGILEDESMGRIDQYYPELRDIENEYKKLGIIHNVPYSFLIYLEFDEKTGRRFNDDDSPAVDEIEEFLRHTKKVYDLGAELIISLKG